MINPFQLHWYILLLLQGCFVACYTNLDEVPREDRIEIELFMETVVPDCSVIDEKGDSIAPINFEVYYPEGFDHILKPYPSTCTFQVSEKKIIINLGKLEGMYSYLVWKPEAHSGNFFYLTNRNTYSPETWFRFGNLGDNKRGTASIFLGKPQIKLDLDVEFQRPLFHKDDSFMLNELGHSIYSIHGCTRCLQSDSTIAAVLAMEMNYLKMHIEAIDDPVQFGEELLRRFDLTHFPAGIDTSLLVPKEEKGFGGFFHGD